MSYLLASIDGQDVVNIGRGAFREVAGANVEFSADGRWAAWPVLESSVGGRLVAAVRLAELRSGAPWRSRPTPIEGGQGDDVALPLLSPTGRTLWKLTGVDSAGFLDDDRVWVVRRGASGREFVTHGLTGGEQRGVVPMGR